MASQATFNDNLTSLVSGMGTDRDKSATVSYPTVVRDDSQTINAYRGSWLARKVVDQFAKDATRKWREWQADSEQITLLEQTEKRLDARKKLEDCQRLADLFGVAHICIGTDDENTQEPLRPDRIKKDGVKYLNVLDRRWIVDGDVDDDPFSEFFGHPKEYMLSNGAIVHPSRLVTLYGEERPDDLVYGKQGDSKLISVLPSITRYHSIVQNVASLVFEARVDVITVPGLAGLLQDEEQSDAIMARFREMARMKGNNGLVLLNGSENPDMPSEEWEQKNFQFSTLPDVVEKAEQEVSGAAGMPRAILFGTSAGGLGSTGDLELSSYYDRINTVQTNKFEPAMSLLDECVIRSAIGNRPPEIWYEWRSLWQVSDKERAEINERNSNAISKFNEALSSAPEFMIEPMINKATESQLLPGLEAAYNEWLDGGGSLENDENAEDLITNGT